MLRVPGSLATLLVLLLSWRAAVGAEKHRLFDCDLGRRNWKNVWSKPKQDWCCQYVHRGCASQLGKFDCKSDDNQDSWSHDKKGWCCMNENVGCKYDCHVKPGEHWRPKHARWCCTMFPPVGCGDHNQLIYNCHSNAVRWETGWSNRKKAYCCENHPPLGCTSEARHFDCDAGLDKWMSGWSQAKKDFCCDNHPPKGCPGQDLYDCTAGVAKWSSGWSDDKKKFCCNHHKVGCPPGDPFDCAAGLAAWETGWSKDKKTWCCRNKQLGCMNDYRCDDLDNWWERWTQAKKDWCCYHHNPPHGCPSDDHYNCVAGLPKNWSPKKQDWCCEHHNLGCPKPFNCSAGVEHWQRGWSEQKQNWCCSHAACPEEYACKVGDPETWVQSKKDWCCQHYHVGCQPQDVPVMPATTAQTTPERTPDCSRGFEQRSSWSKHKTCYCCRRHGIACPPVYYEGRVPPNAIICDVPAMAVTGEEEITPQVRSSVGTGSVALVLLLPLGAVYALGRWRRERTYARTYAPAPLYAAG